MNGLTTTNIIQITPVGGRSAEKLGPEPSRGEDFSIAACSSATHDGAYFEAEVVDVDSVNDV